MLIVCNYFWFGLKPALWPLRSAMAMRIVIAITIVTTTTITTATTPPIMATVLPELEPAGAAGVCGGEVTGILSPGPTGTAEV